MAKQIKAWGVKRDKVDIEKLAFAYYLLARRIVEDERQADTSAESVADPSDREPKDEAA